MLRRRQSEGPECGGRASATTALKGGGGAVRGVAVCAGALPLSPAQRVHVGKTYAAGGGDVPGPIQGRDLPPLVFLAAQRTIARY